MHASRLFFLSWFAATVVVSTAAAQDRSAGAHGYWRAFAEGVITSLGVHEGGHIVTAYAVGGRPSFGFNKGRPTIYSGINSQLEPRKQFEFSSAGLTAQSLLDEGILDVPHERGTAFERGMLAGGIGTALFYATIGRNGSVSDMDFMSRTSSLSKNELTVIVGGIAVLHTIRVSRDGHYANFFMRPSTSGALRIGVWTQ